MTGWALRTALDLEGLNAHLEALEAAGLLGIVEERGAATAYFPDRRDDLPVEGRWEPVPDVDWGDQWRRHARVVRVGDLVVAPPWLAEDAQTIVIEPAQAFGTGDHETTQACLAALCEAGVEGGRVLDVGTGSGVLAIAAARLGAAKIVACDTDPLAVDAARRNAAANQATVDVRAGSVDAIDGVFDVVVANLDTDTITALASALAARLAPTGVLIVSGVGLERAAEATDALAAAGLDVDARPGRQWALLAARSR